MPGHRKKKHTGQFPRSTTSPTQEVEEGGGLHTAVAVATTTVTTNHAAALLGVRPVLQQTDTSLDHNDAPSLVTPIVEAVIAQTLEELLQYPDVTGLSTEQIKDALRANLALKSQKRLELGAEEYDRQVKAYDERIIDKGKPIYTCRHVPLTKNGLIRAVDELSKKGSAQYTIEEEYLVVKTVCLLALRKIKGYVTI